jgi:hypothetical protein
MTRTANSNAISPTTVAGLNAYGLAWVSRVEYFSRAGVYRFLNGTASRAIARRPGPAGPCPDADLADHIRREIQASDPGNAAQAPLGPPPRFAAPIQAFDPPAIDCREIGMYRTGVGVGAKIRMLRFFLFERVDIGALPRLSTNSQKKPRSAQLRGR